MSDVAKELHAATDELNRVILNVEQVFRDLNLGVPARVRIDQDNYVGFGKENQKWRLLWIRILNEEEESIEPLTNAPRQIRLESVDKLPMLKEKLYAEAEESVDEVKEATAKLKKTWGLE